MRRSKPGRKLRGSCELTASPLNTISPAVTVSICAIMLSSVDLPAPDGPMMVRNSPGVTEKERPWMTHGEGSRPCGVGKGLPRLLISSNAAMAYHTPVRLNRRCRVGKGAREHSTILDTLECGRRAHASRPRLVARSTRGHGARARAGGKRTVLFACAHSASKTRVNALMAHPTLMRNMA